MSKSEREHTVTRNQMNQPTFFPSGDDLPLFTGQPVKADVRQFDPKLVAAQESFLDLRPVFGVPAAEVEVKPASEPGTEE